MIYEVMLDIIDHGPVRELKLARPPANALNSELIAALREQVNAAQSDDGPRALVLSGQPRMFSAGLDVAALLKLDRAALHKTWQDFFGVMYAIVTSRIPIAAAITGHSPAGGAVLALFCDYRIMARGDFKIGLNEVQVGLMLPSVIHKALAFAVGPRQAERLAVGGLLISPDEAYRVGLIDELTAVEDTVAHALTWAEALIKLPPEAQRRTRAIARAGLISAFDDFDDQQVESFVEGWFSDETQTAMKALVARLSKK